MQAGARNRPSDPDDDNCVIVWEKEADEVSPRPAAPAAAAQRPKPRVGIQRAQKQVLSPAQRPQRAAAARAGRAQQHAAPQGRPGPQAQRRANEQKAAELQEKIRSLTEAVMEIEAKKQAGPSANVRSMAAGQQQANTAMPRSRQPSPAGRPAVAAAVSQAPRGLQPPNDAELEQLLEALHQESVAAPTAPQPQHQQQPPAAGLAPNRLTAAGGSSATPTSTPPATSPQRSGQPRPTAAATAAVAEQAGTARPAASPRRSPMQPAAAAGIGAPAGAAGPPAPTAAAARVTRRSSAAQPGGPTAATAGAAASILAAAGSAQGISFKLQAPPALLPLQRLVRAAGATATAAAAVAAATTAAGTVAAAASAPAPKQQQPLPAGPAATEARKPPSALLQQARLPSASATSASAGGDQPLQLALVAADPELPVQQLPGSLSRGTASRLLQLMAAAGGSEQLTEALLEARGEQREQAMQGLLITQHCLLREQVLWQELLRLRGEFQHGVAMADGVLQAHMPEGWTAAEGAGPLLGAGGPLPPPLPPLGASLRPRQAAVAAVAIAAAAPAPPAADIAMAEVVGEEPSRMGDVASAAAVSAAGQGNPDASAVGMADTAVQGNPDVSAVGRAANQTEAASAAAVAHKRPASPGNAADQQRPAKKQASSTAAAAPAAAAPAAPGAPQPAAPAAPVAVAAAAPAPAVAPVTAAPAALAAPKAAAPAVVVAPQVAAAAQPELTSPLPTEPAAVVTSAQAAEQPGGGDSGASSTDMSISSQSEDGEVTLDGNRPPEPAGRDMPGPAAKQQGSKATAGAASTGKGAAGAVTSAKSAPQVAAKRPAAAGSSDMRSKSPAAQRSGNQQHSGVQQKSRSPLRRGRSPGRCARSGSPGPRSPVWRGRSPRSPARRGCPRSPVRRVTRSPPRRVSRSPGRLRLGGATVASRRGRSRSRSWSPHYRRARSRSRSIGRGARQTSAVDSKRARRDSSPEVKRTQQDSPGRQPRTRHAQQQQQQQAAAKGQAAAAPPAAKGTGPASKWDNPAAAGNPVAAANGVVPAGAAASKEASKPKAPSGIAAAAAAAAASVPLAAGSSGATKWSTAPIAAGPPAATAAAASTAAAAAASAAQLPAAKRWDVMDADGPVPPPPHEPPEELPPLPKEPAPLPPDAPPPPLPEGPMGLLLAAPSVQPAGLVARHAPHAVAGLPCVPAPAVEGGQLGVPGGSWGGTAAPGLAPWTAAGSMVPQPAGASPVPSGAPLGGRLLPAQPAVIPLLSSVVTAASNGVPSVTSLPPPAPAAPAPEPPPAAGARVASLAAQLLSGLLPSSASSRAAAGGPAAGHEGDGSWQKPAAAGRAGSADPNNTSAAPAAAVAQAQAGAAGSGFAAGFPTASSGSLPAAVQLLVGSICGQEALHSVLSISSREREDSLPGGAAAAGGVATTAAMVVPPEAPAPIPQAPPPQQQQQQKQQQQPAPQLLPPMLPQVPSNMVLLPVQGPSALPAWFETAPTCIKYTLKRFSRAPSAIGALKGLDLFDPEVPPPGQPGQQGSSLDGLLPLLRLAPAQQPAAAAEGIPAAAGLPAGPASRRRVAGSSSNSGSVQRSELTGLAPYCSPLLRFRSYRLSSNFPAAAQQAGGAGALSDTYCHAVEPLWPMCLQDTMGSHLDPSCRHQHWRDVQITGATAKLSELQVLLCRAGMQEAGAAAVAVEATRVLQQQQHAALAQQAAAWQQQQQQRAHAGLANQGPQALPASSWQLPALEQLAAAADVAADAVEWRVQRVPGTQQLQPQRRGVSEAAKAAAADAAVPAYDSMVAHAVGSGATRGRVGRCVHLTHSRPRPALLRRIGEQPTLLEPGLPLLNQWGCPLTGLDYVHLMLNLPTPAQRAQLQQQQQPPHEQQQQRRPRRAMQRQLWQPDLAVEPPPQAPAAAAAAAIVPVPQQRPEEATVTEVTQAMQPVTQAYSVNEGLADQHTNDWDFFLHWGLGVLDFDSQDLPWGVLIKQRLLHASKAILVGLHRRSPGLPPSVELLAAALPPIVLQAALTDKGVEAFARGILQRPACYQLWMTAAYGLPRWQQQALFLLRGALHLAAAVEAKPPWLTPFQANAARAACIVDCVLRLLQTLHAAGQEQVAKAWCLHLYLVLQSDKELAATVERAQQGLSGQAVAWGKLLSKFSQAAESVPLRSAPPPDDRDVKALLQGTAGSALCQGLGLALHWQPLLAQVMWASLYDLAILGALPLAVEADLGHQQRAVLLEDPGGPGSSKQGGKWLAAPFKLPVGNVPLAALGEATRRCGPGQRLQGVAAHMAAVRNVVAQNNVSCAQLKTLTTHFSDTNVGDLAILVGQPLVAALSLAPGQAPAQGDNSQQIGGILQQARMALSAARQGVNEGSLLQRLLVPLTEPPTPAPVIGQQQQQQGTAAATATDAHESAAAAAASDCRRLQWQLLHAALEKVDLAVLRLRQAVLTAAGHEVARVAPNFQFLFQQRHPFLHVLELVATHPKLVLLQPLWSSLAAVVLKQKEQGRQDAKLLLGLGASGLLVPVLWGERSADQLLVPPAPPEVRDAHQLLFDEQVRAEYLLAQAHGHQMDPSLLLPFADGFPSTDLLAYARVNAACYEALEGDPERAMQHFQEAVQLAQGCPPCEQHILEAVWRQYLQFLAALVAEGQSLLQAQEQELQRCFNQVAAVAGQQRVTPAEQRELYNRMREPVAAAQHRVQVAQQCLLEGVRLAFSKGCGSKQVHPLLFPVPNYGSQELKKGLQPAPRQDATHVLEAVADALGMLGTEQRVPLIELLVELCPPSPQLVHLLLGQAVLHASSASWLQWLLPLVADAAAHSSPAPRAMDWLVLLGLLKEQSAAAAARLVQVALQQHPWNLALWKLHVEAAGDNEQLRAQRQQLARAHGLMEDQWMAVEVPQQQPAGQEQREQQPPAQRQQQQQQQPPPQQQQQHQPKRQQQQQQQQQPKRQRQQQQQAPQGNQQQQPLLQQQQRQQGNHHQQQGWQFTWQQQQQGWQFNQQAGARGGRGS